MFPELVKEKVVLRKCRNLCVALETIHLSRKLTSKEVEGVRYLFSHGHHRKEKPKYHSTRDDLYNTQTKIIEACKCELIYLTL